MTSDDSSTQVSAFLEALLNGGGVGEEQPSGRPGTFQTDYDDDEDDDNDNDDEEQMSSLLGTVMTHEQAMGLVRSFALEDNENTNDAADIDARAFM
jgi:hypothetical protein